MTIGSWASALRLLPSCGERRVKLQLDIKWAQYDIYVYIRSDNVNSVSEQLVFFRWRGLAEANEWCWSWWSVADDKFHKYLHRNKKEEGGHIGVTLLKWSEMFSVMTESTLAYTSQPRSNSIEVSRMHQTTLNFDLAENVAAAQSWSSVPLGEWRRKMWDYLRPSIPRRGNRKPASEQERSWRSISHSQLKIPTFQHQRERGKQQKWVWTWLHWSGNDSKEVHIGKELSYRWYQRQEICSHALGHCFY